MSLPVPDGVLVDRMIAGDSRAMTQLHQRYFLTLYAGAYGVVYDAVTTESLVNEVLQLAWRQARSYRPERFGSVHRWLLGLLRARTYPRRSAPWMDLPRAS